VADALLIRIYLAVFPKGEMAGVNVPDKLLLSFILFLFFLSPVVQHIIVCLHFKIFFFEPGGMNAKKDFFFFRPVKNKNKKIKKVRLKTSNGGYFFFNIYFDNR